MHPIRGKARRCSFTLAGDLKAQAEERAASLGWDFSAYIAAVVRNDLLRPDADLVTVCDAKKPRAKV